MINGDQIDSGSSLVCQLYSAAKSTVGRIVIRGLITAITRSLGVEPNPKDQVLGSERLNKAAFK